MRDEAFLRKAGCGLSNRNSTRPGDAVVNSTFGNRGPRWLIKDGYASADSMTEWTGAVGGRGRGPLEPGPGTRLFLVRR